MEQYEGPLTPTEKALEQERAKVKRLELRLLIARSEKLMLLLRMLADRAINAHEDRWFDRWEPRIDKVIAINAAARGMLNVDR